MPLCLILLHFTCQKYTQTTITIHNKKVTVAELRLFGALFQSRTLQQATQQNQ